MSTGERMSEKENKCGYCNEPAGYYQNPMYIKKRARKYCSQTCNHRARQDRKMAKIRAERAAKNCPYCGTDIPLSRPNNTTYCSRTCQSRHTKGFIYSEVIKSKLPQGVLLDPEDRIRAMAYVESPVHKKWTYKEQDNSSPFISTTRTDGSHTAHGKKAGAAGSLISLHRFVMGVSESDIVIHLNGDYNDCRKSNLKVVTQEEATTSRNTERTEDTIIDGIPKKKMVFDTMYGIKEVLFDPEDWDVVKKYPWTIKHRGNRNNSGYTDYAQASIPHPDGGTTMKRKVYKGKEYFYETKRKTAISMHRLILGLGIASAKKGNKDLHVDHADLNGLNNCRDNLRVCKPEENMRNQRRRKDNTTGYKGVKRAVSSCILPYQANINFEGKRYYLGTYATPEEAARAYDAKAKELHGEFAYLNFPEQ